MRPNTRWSGLMAVWSVLLASALARCCWRCRHPGRREPGVLVHPGMEIRQGKNVCTLGFVDPGRRVAFTAGHCRGNGAVSDVQGNVIGNLAAFRDNTPTARPCAPTT